MPGRPAKVDHVRDKFLDSVASAGKLVDSVQKVSVVNPQPGIPRLHIEQARRVIELAFLGVVANWEEFLEQSFVRYMAGAKSSGGTQPAFRMGKTVGIDHSYHVLSGDSSFDPTRNYSKFGEPKWVIDTARIYFENGAPFAPRMQAYLEPLQAAIKIRNRVAHNSQKCREDFKKVAKVLLALQSTAKLTQGYSVGDLLKTKPIAMFSNKIKAKYPTYFEAYCGLFTYLAHYIVAKEQR